MYGTKHLSLHRSVNHPRLIVKDFCGRLNDSDCLGEIFVAPDKRHIQPTSGIDRIKDVRFSGWCKEKRNPGLFGPEWPIIPYRERTIDHGTRCGWVRWNLIGIKRIIVIRLAQLSVYAIRNRCAFQNCEKRQIHRFLFTNIWHRITYLEPSHPVSNLLHSDFVCQLRLYSVNCLLAKKICEYVVLIKVLRCRNDCHQNDNKAYG